MTQNWLPLQSSPEVMNPFLQDLGIDTNKYQFYPVYSMEDWALEMVPQEVAAVLFLFPIKKDQPIQKQEQTSPDIYYMKQYATNACGTIAIFHAILNNLNLDIFQNESCVNQFYQQTKDQNWEQRGESFQNNQIIYQKHSKGVHSEHSDLNVEEEVDTHFVAFIKRSLFIKQITWFLNQMDDKMDLLVTGKLVISLFQET